MLELDLVLVQDLVLAQDLGLVENLEQEQVLDLVLVQEQELDLEQVLLDLELVKLFHQLVFIKKLMEVQLLDHQLLEVAYYQL